MSKYDKMVALNAERSREKMEKAKKTIWEMVDQEEKVDDSQTDEEDGAVQRIFL